MIITLCGSAKFESAYHEFNEQLTMAGFVVFGLAVLPSFKGRKDWYTESEKQILDLAHIAKIEASDAIVVLNVDGYVGESTLREITWARMRQKEIYWLHVPDDVEGNDMYNDGSIIELLATHSFLCVPLEKCTS